MRKIGEDQDGLFEYYMSDDGRRVYYYGGFSGRKSGLFGDSLYWKYHVHWSNRVVHGPWQFLDSISEETFWM